MHTLDSSPVLFNRKIENSVVRDWGEVRPRTTQLNIGVQIIQLILSNLCISGPKGSSYVYGSHGDEKVHSLEKKVFKLENEVTVLETAMANLAKRLLVVEQKSGLKNRMIN